MVGGRTPCENEINLWPHVNVCAKPKHALQTTTHTHTVHMFDWSKVHCGGPGLWGQDWCTLTFHRCPFRWSGRDGRAEPTEGRHSAGTASPFAAAGRGRDSGLNDNVAIRWGEQQWSRKQQHWGGLRLRMSHRKWCHAAPFQNWFTQPSGQKWATSATDKNFKQNAPR